MEGRWWEGEWGDAGQIGVKAEEEGRVRLEGGGWGVAESFGGRGGEAESAGLAEGRMGETSVADDWPADWRGGRAKAGGRVAEDGEEAAAERG